MDNLKSKALTETIDREKRIQRQYYKSQAAAGKLTAQPPQEREAAPSLMDTVGVPAHVATIKNDPELSIGMTLSRNMWTANPGYIMRDGTSMASVTKKDYVWDQEEIDFMKSQGELDKKFNRRRDDFTHYVEASSKMKLLIKSQGNVGGGK